MIDIILQVYNECKGKDVICGFYNFIQPAFVVIDPDLAKNILIKDFNNFVNRGTYVNEEDEPLSGKKSYLFTCLIITYKYQGARHSSFF